jgi:DNA-binding response OmpR family regulator
LDTVAIGAHRSDESIQAALGNAGCICAQFGTTAALVRGLRREHFDAVIIDVDCADIGWPSFLQRQRNCLSLSLVVLLAGPAPGAAAALEAGADDFVAKPLVPCELLARLANARRRHRAPAALQRMARAGCEVDLQASRLLGAHGGVTLTARELAVAQIFFEHPGEVISRQRLANDIWGCDEELAARSIEQHVYQLRRKLRRCAGDALALRGIYGSGYQLAALTSANDQ